MVQRTNGLQHSNKDIAVENVRVSSDDSSISKEKYDLEVQTPVEEISDQNTDDGHPDGGLTAWLIVAGVRLLFPIVTVQSYSTSPPFLRLCVIQARRKYSNSYFLPFFIVHIPRKQKSRTFTLIPHASPDFIPYFRTGLAMLIHGA